MSTKSINFLILKRGKEKTLRKKETKGYYIRTKGCLSENFLNGRDCLCCDYVYSLLCFVVWKILERLLQWERERKKIPFLCLATRQLVQREKNPSLSLLLFVCVFCMNNNKQIVKLIHNVLTAELLLLMFRISLMFFWWIEFPFFLY